MNERIEAVKKRIAAVPRAKLGFFPTPLYRLDRLSERLGVELYVKRDDFSGMSLFGGNKIRKLEFLMGDALERGCDTVFTYGATQSNHAMQTVTACRRLGLEPILYLNTYVEPDENDIRSNMLLDRILGAEMHIIRSENGETEADTEARCVVLAHRQAAELEAQGHRCYDVPMGGASEVGSAGFIAGWAEMEEQCADMGIAMDAVYCATGTGGTLAGLAAGRHLTGSAAKLAGIAVSPKDAGYEARTAALATKAAAYLGEDAVIAADEFGVDRGYYLPGYEQPNAAATEAIRLLARAEGLFLDPVYTGKAFAGLLDHIRTGRVPAGSRVLFWHTGGATALFAEKEILGELSE